MSRILCSEGQLLQANLDAAARDVATALEDEKKDAREACRCAIKEYFTHILRCVNCGPYLPEDTWTNE